ncbi:flagellar protein FlaG [Lutibacter sp. B2]|nr:flagellar protein FlaG [Lutibacter sp. B2]
MEIEGNSMNTQMQYRSQNNQRTVNIEQVQQKENISEEKKGSFPGEKQLIKSIEKENKDLKITNIDLKFSIHEKTKQIMVKVIDDTTKEVIREIPSKKILDMVADMMEKAGLFVDKKA